MAFIFEYIWYLSFLMRDLQRIGSIFHELQETVPSLQEWAPHLFLEGFWICPFDSFCTWELRKNIAHLQHDEEGIVALISFCSNNAKLLFFCGKQGSLHDRVWSGRISWDESRGRELNPESRALGGREGLAHRVLVSPLCWLQGTGGEEMTGLATINAQPL